MISKRPVKQLLKQLQRKGIKHPQVLAAIEQVPREKFVHPDYKAHAYEDSALPLTCGQTISQPYVVAAMTEAALAEHNTLGRVLEIGTGSGYQAAILSYLANDVYSIERIEDLHQRAFQVLADYHNVHLLYGDGRLGWPEHAPYDAILVTAATAEVPQALLEQLADGGRLVIPVGSRYSQQLQVHTRLGNDFKVSTLDYVIFVPLLGGTE